MDDQKSTGILLKLKQFFGYPALKDFRDDYNKLTEEDKEQLKRGIEDGTYNY